MSLKLNFYKPYPSVDTNISFPESLPPLSIITGYNGCGKTRLLEAIKYGSVKAEVDGNEVDIGAIEYYNNRTIEPKTEIASNVDYRDERDEFWLALQECCNVDYAEASFAGVKTKFGLPNVRTHLPYFLANLDGTSEKNEVRKVLLIRQSQLLRSLEGLFTQSVSAVKAGGRARAGEPKKPPSDREKGRARAYRSLSQSGITTTDIIRPIAAKLGATVYEWTKNDFIDCYPLDIQTNLFERSFSRWFTKYIDYELRNESIKHNESMGNGVKVSLNATEFIGNYGNKPWEVVDEILQAAGIDYTISRPSYLPEDTYTAALVDSKGVEVPLTDLSSGEKTILSLFSSLSYAADIEELKVLPKILLLDEVDASLHPSLTKYLITMLDKYCGNREIYIILATHSPSTVAMSKEECLHVLRRGEAGSQLNKTSADAAINLLTAGIPTLSVRQELRRPVFVESAYDVGYYEALYKKYYDSTSGDRDSNSVSLSFIAAAGTHKGGCAVVREQVEALRGANNTTIFGIVDWDGGDNEETDYIFIPGAESNRRYSTENYILDPIAVCMYLLSEGKIDAEEIGLIKGTEYPEIPELPVKDIELMVKTFIDIVLGKQDDSALRTCSYGKGLKVKIPEKFLAFNGHKYEENIKNLYDNTKNTSFIKDVISKVHSHYPKIIPIELNDLFARIEGAPTVSVGD